MSAAHGWCWTASISIIVMKLVACGDLEAVPSRLVGRVTQRLELPTRGGSKYFVVDLPVASHYERFGAPEIGQVGWVSSGRPRIELRVNPTVREDIFDPHRPCTNPALTLPAPYGTQLACISWSSYLVVRDVIWGDESLRCSIEVTNSDPRDVGDAWELCARMMVRLDAPTLEPAVADRFVLVGETGDYEVEIQIPSRYRVGSPSPRDGGRVYLRGNDEPRIYVRETQDTSTPCGDGRELQPPRANGDGIALCDFGEGFEGIRRMVTVGARLLECSTMSRQPTGASRLVVSKALSEVCASVRVLARRPTQKAGNHN